MTSKTLSDKSIWRKLFRETFKQNAALLLLFTLAYFCVYPLLSMFLIQGWEESAAYNVSAHNFFWETIYDSVKVQLAFNGAAALLAAGAGALVGLVQFSWMHSREKTDFYHSLPVRRETLFILQYMSGALVWFAAFIVNLLLAACLTGMRGYLPPDGWLLVGKSALLMLVTFLTMYGFMALAVVMTGKLFVAVLGMAVFCFYFVGAGLLSMCVKEVYFSSMVISDDVERYVFFTPLYGLYRMWLRFYNTEMSARDVCLGMFLLSCLVALLALLLYRRRGSEAAGKSMAFSGAARVIKFLLVVPLAFATQIFFYLIGNHSNAWAVFGLVFGLLLFSGVIEFIYHMDIRELFADKKQLLLSLAAVAASMLILETDPMGIDRWMPQKQEIEGAMLAERYFGTEVSERKYELYQDGSEMYYQFAYGTDEHTWEIEDLDAFYELMEKRRQPRESDQNYLCSMDVVWNMRNGTHKRRRYFFSEEDFTSFWDELLQSPKQRENVFPLLSVKPEELLHGVVYDEDVCDASMSGRLDPQEDIRRVYTEDILNAQEHGYDAEEMEMAKRYNSTELMEETADTALPDEKKAIAAEAVDEWGKSRELVMNREQRAKLFAVLQEELRNVPLNQEEYEPVRVCFLYTGENGRVYGTSVQVFPEMKKTRALLETYGVEFDRT